jgi:hypothetical protein
LTLVRTGSLLGAVLVLCLSSARAREADETTPVASCRVPPAIDAPALPDDFPDLEGVSVTEAKAKKEFIATEGFSRRSVEELFEGARPVLAGNGFDVVNSDYEGFEAELYFAKGDSLAGIVALREAVCDGYVKVNVMYDPLDTEAGRRAVRKTRRLSGEG